MKILRDKNDLIKAIKKIKKLGFVPTMGGIHKGHISLIKESQKKCEKTLVSIYVNPKQFNKKNDFNEYPRQINKDLKILKKCNLDFVFLPNTNLLYKKKSNRKFIIPNKEKILCAKFRKGHFEGVLNVMDRFTKLIKPNYIFMGEKDYQQFFLINKYLDKNLNIKIYPCKTIRNKNFVALSTRNYLLTKKQLNIAGFVAKRLYKFKKLIENNYNIYKKLKHLKLYLEKKTNIKIEYLELRNEKNLDLFKKNNKCRLFIAYYINKVRLIDNF